MKLANLMADWKVIRTELKRTPPFVAQVQGTGLHLRKMVKDVKPVKAVQCARSWRLKTDPPHDEENPSYGYLFATSESEEQCELLSTSLKHGWYANETLNLSDDETTDKKGGPLGELCATFLQEYAKHCAAIAKGDEPQVGGTPAQALEVLLHGCRITHSLVDPEAQAFGTEYVETFHAFETGREKTFDESLEMYIDILRESAQWKPRIAAYIIDAENDDAIGPRLQHIKARLIREPASHALLMEAFEEFKWLMGQKHREGGYNKLIDLMLKCLLVNVGEDPTTVGLEHAVDMVGVLQKLKVGYSWSEEWPKEADKVAKTLRAKTAQEKKQSITKEIADTCRKWDGDMKELSEFCTKVTAIREDAGLDAGTLEDLKDMRGNVLTKLVRAVRNAEHKSEEVVSNLCSLGNTLGVITGQAAVKKGDSETPEAKVVTSVMKLGDAIMSLKTRRKCIREEVADDDKIASNKFLEELEEAKRDMQEYDEVTKDAKEGNYSGASYLTNLDADGRLVKNDVGEIVEQQSERLDAHYQNVVRRETKRVQRVAGGGDKTDWKKDLTGEEKLTDAEFVGAAKTLATTFHEEDFVDRRATLVQDRGFG